MKLLKILLSVFMAITFVHSNELIQKDLNDKSFSINKNSFKIVEFEKMIENIKVSDEKNIEIDFVENNLKPLQSIKIFAKEIGHGNILITFIDSTSMHIDINIVENLRDIIAIANQISNDLEITQINGKIILKGMVEDRKIKDKILDLFKKAGVDTEKDLIDLINLKNPEKMIRLKLYAVEINNNKGLDLKNNWFVSGKNYIQTINKDKLYENLPLNPTTDQAWNDANNQRNVGVHDAIDSLMTNAVSLTGGLTGAANYLGKYFNAGLTLNYLASEGVASILDETTLLTLENQDATFHAGGTIYLKVQTTTDTGVPSTQIKNINYGLQLDIKAQNIVNDNYVNLNITTKSTQIDWTNTVDGIPSFTEKSIKTNVVVGDESTIILGGLISSSNSKDINKIPLLSDIPILGALFTSKAFREGKSELVFFITPEIVDPKENNQFQLLENKINYTKTLEIEKKDIKKENTDVTTHEQRVKEILGQK
uniref:hypothetical protein n=1 Tax=Aliarcobacter sp. TaxID=2321116 RepID=UPI004047A3D2